MALVLSFACAAWLVIVAILWQTTARMVPTVNVRWVENVSDAQKTATEQELSLVPHETLGPNTVNYFLVDTAQENTKRIVVHPLIEDTAFISRGSFMLENPPLARMWLGHRFKVLASPVLLVVVGLGCLTFAEFGFGPLHSRDSQ